MMANMRRRPFDADGMPILKGKPIYYFVYFESGKITPKIKKDADVRLIFRYPNKKRLVWSCLMGMGNLENSPYNREVLNDQITKKASTAKRIALKRAQLQIHYREKEIKQITHWIEKTKKEKV